MIDYVTLEPSGVIKSFGRSYILPEMAIVIPNDISLDELQNYYLDPVTLVWSPRPQIDIPSLDTEGLTMSNLPSGTMIEVTIPSGYYVQIFEEAGVIDLGFADQGSYHLELNPPAPYKGWEITLEIN